MRENGVKYNKDLKVLKAKLKRLPRTGRELTDNEIVLIKEVMEEEDTVFAVVKGIIGTSSASGYTIDGEYIDALFPKEPPLLVALQNHLCFIKHKSEVVANLHPVTAKCMTIPYSEIASIDVDKGWISCDIRIKFRKGIRTDKLSCVDQEAAEHLSEWFNCIKQDVEKRLDKKRKADAKEEERKNRERKNREREEMEREEKKRKIASAQDKEKHLDYDGAIAIYEEIGDKKSAKRVRKLKADLAAPKTEIHGDYIDDRDTIVKDSVLNRSNVGGGSSKMQELKDLTEMKKEGLIDDDEFKQMKKEILGK